MRENTNTHETPRPRVDVYPTLYVGRVHLTEHTEVYKCICMLDADVGRIADTIAYNIIR